MGAPGRRQRVRGERWQKLNRRRKIVHLGKVEAVVDARRTANGAARIVAAILGEAETNAWKDHRKSILTK
jgi:hypothetical protein